MRSVPSLLAIGFISLAACSMDPSAPANAEPEDSGTTPPRDSGTTPPRDSGVRDAGSDGGKDSGTDGSTDSGTDSGADSGTSTDAMPTGAISYFNTACPSGWQPYSTVIGRTIVAQSPANTPIAGGPGAYNSGEAPGHTHAIDVELDFDQTRYVLAGGGANGGLADNVDKVPVSGQTAQANAVVPYVQLMACRKTAAPVAGAIPRGMTAYFETACPSSWNAMSYYDGYIVIGSAEGGDNETTFGSYTPLASGENRTHSHTASGSWSPASHGITGASGCCSPWYASSAAIPYSTTSSAVESSPPYLQLHQCMKI